MRVVSLSERCWALVCCFYRVFFPALFLHAGVNQFADHFRVPVGGYAQEPDEDQSGDEGISRRGVAATSFHVEMPAKCIESEVVR